MKLIKKIKKVSKFGLFNFKILGAPDTLVGIDGINRGQFQTFRMKDDRKLNDKIDETNELFSKFNEIEEIFFKNNKDAKDLISNINGVAAISAGIANEQYEAIRISYDAISLDLNILIKIYSFTTGDKIIFNKDETQKNKFSDILNSMNISMDIIDLVNFE